MSFSLVPSRDVPRPCGGASRACTLSTVASFDAIHDRGGRACTPADLFAFHGSLDEHHSQAWIAIAFAQRKGLEPGGAACPLARFPVCTLARAIRPA